MKKDIVSLHQTGAEKQTAAKQKAKAHKNPPTAEVLGTFSSSVFFPSLAENQWSRPSRTAAG